MSNPAENAENKAAPSGESKSGGVSSASITRSSGVDAQISRTDVKNPNATAVDGGKAKGAAARQENK